MGVYNPQHYSPLPKGQTFCGVLDFCITDTSGEVVCFLSDGARRVSCRANKVSGVILVPRRRYVVSGGEIRYA